MATVVVFWSVIIAAVFFILSIIFNAIGAIIEAIEEVITYILGIVVLVGLLFLAFNLIIGIVANWGNLWLFIGSILLTLIVIGIILAISGWLFTIVGIVLLTVISWLHDGSEAIAVGCIKCFNHFVRVIQNRMGIS